MSLTWDDMPEKLREAYEEDPSAREWIDRISYLALTDPRTGLPNIWAYQQDIRALIERSQRHGLTFALLAIDLDDLRGLNTKYGHPAVNDAFLRLGTALNGVTRTHDRRETSDAYTGERRSNERRKLPEEHDKFYRTGGDEFSGLLPGVEDRERVDARLATIYNTVREVYVSSSDVSDATHLSASIGIAIYPRDGRDEHELHEVADKNLYVAKNTNGLRINGH